MKFVFNICASLLHITIHNNFQMILMIYGYRDYNDYHDFISYVNNFIIKYGEPDQIIFGDCIGTDLLAKKYVQENKLSYKIFRADRKTFGKSAGPIRNNEMIKVATHMLAFLSKKSKKTKQVIESAKKVGLTVDIIKIDFENDSD